MSRTTKFMLSIEFKCNAAADADVEFWVGVKAESAGTFLPTATRDMQFEFPNRRAAQRALARIKKHVQIDHYSIEPWVEEDTLDG